MNMRRLGAVFLALSLLIGNVFYFLPGTASAASAITVAQAIAKNNSGETATVEGFIVGEVYNSKPIFSNFQDDLNFLIADTASETDKTKLIDVQITASYRSQYGLKSNPTHVGKKVQVTGTLTAYSGMNGVKNPTGFVLDGTPGGGENPNPTDPGSENIGIPTTLPDGTGKKVLFDQSHAQTAGASDWVIDGAFSDFADGLKAAGFQVDALERTIPYSSQAYDTPTITLSKLKAYNVFVIGEANIPFKSSEQEAMLQYVKEGGSIFFISDHYNADRNLNRWDSSEVMNGYRRGAYNNPSKGMAAAEVASGAMQGVTSTDWLGQNFGVRFRYNALGDFTKTDTVKYDQSFGITAGVNDVEMHAGSTMVVLDPTRVKGLVYIPKTTSGWNNAVEKSDPANFPNGGVYKGGGVDEGPFAAIAKLQKGKAAFIGDSSPVEDVTPRYVREDNGSKKTTYDGFKSEGQNNVFLVQTVKWLAVQEDYTTFENKGITLDSTTPLLASGLENPATSVEIAGTEPWGNPAAGYKWYDPATYKPGSYGTGKGTPEVPIPDLTTIGEARKVSDNTYVTVQGIVTSEPGIFGGSGFYMQDGTAGIYIYPSQPTGFHAGDKVKITAQKTVFNTEIELINDAKVEKLDANANIPAAVPVVQTTLNDDNQGTLITLKDVTIQNYATVTNSLEFDLVRDGVTSRVRVDSRTNIIADTFKQSFPAGTKVDISGISSIFIGTYQLKLLKSGDVQLASQANQPPVFKAIEAQSVVEGQPLTFQVEATDADGDNLTYTAPTLPGNATFDAISRQFSWTPQTSGDYTASFYVTDGKGGEATINVSITVTPAAHGTSNAATLTGPASSYAGSAANLTVGMKNVTDGFTVGSIVVQYDPNVWEFATKSNADGTLALADIALSSDLDNSGVLATGVKPDQGQILVIVGSTGADHVIKGSGPLVTLHGTVKSNAPTGTTALSISSFDVSRDGIASVLETTQASWHVEVKSADRAALITAIHDAQQLHDNTVVGSAPGQYPASAKAALKDAITAASTVRDNTSSTQEQINAALAALNTAVNTFRNVVNPSTPVDKASLTAAIANAQNLLNKAITGNKVGKYPADAKVALQAAITAATNVLNNISASQAQVDTAVSVLNGAAVTFQSKLITLVPGATKITINDLSIVAKYFGVKSTDPNWNSIAIADVLDEGEITIRTLAAIAQLVVGDWYTKN
ncbi:DUF6359 domain-containing protein [Paenibacillus sp. GCM10027629]|uniref:DUF6359 domain-containing protein n=1 Tax=Paenibacillus sp. GCM10027629 TaxID=3273414 RepID=UPI003637B427